MTKLTDTIVKVITNSCSTEYATEFSQQTGRYLGKKTTTRWIHCFYFFCVFRIPKSFNFAAAVLYSSLSLSLSLRVTQCGILSCIVPARALSHTHLLSLSLSLSSQPLSSLRRACTPTYGHPIKSIAPRAPSWYHCAGDYLPRNAFVRTLYTREGYTHTTATTVQILHASPDFSVKRRRRLTSHTAHTRLESGFPRDRLRIVREPLHPPQTLPPNPAPPSLYQLQSPAAP